MREKVKVEHAVIFASVFELGDVLSSDEFDTWAIGQGLVDDPYNYVNENIDKSDARWAQLLRQRNQTRQSLNRISEVELDEEDRFSIIFDQLTGDYIVMPLHGVLQSRAEQIHVKATTYFSNQDKRIKRLTELVDISTLPTREAIMIEQLTEDANDLFSTVNHMITLAASKQERAMLTLGKAFGALEKEENKVARLIAKTVELNKEALRIKGEPAALSHLPTTTDEVYEQVLKEG